MRGLGMKMNMPWGMGMMVPPPPPHGHNFPPPPKVLELSRKKPELHQAEKPWKPSAKTRGDKPDDRDEEEIVTEEVVKKARSILNKLTPENFNNLVDEFFSMRLEDNDARIGEVVKILFEKAVDEPTFACNYARMVRILCFISIRSYQNKLSNNVLFHIVG